MFYFRTKSRWFENLAVKCKPFELVSREDWGAKRPRYEEELRTPVGHVLLKFDSGTQPCLNKKQCSKALRALQQEQMKDFKFADIEYNFMIGGDGRVYQGRGWKIAPEKPHFSRREYHGRSLAIAYIGDFKDKDPPPIMTETRHDLLAYGINHELVMFKPNIVEIRTEF